MQPGAKCGYFYFPKGRILYLFYLPGAVLTTIIPNGVVFCAAVVGGAVVGGAVVGTHTPFIHVWKIKLPVGSKIILFSTSIPVIISSGFSGSVMLILCSSFSVKNMATVVTTSRPSNIEICPSSSIVISIPLSIPVHVPK